MYNLKITMEYVCCMDVNYANNWLSEICFRKVSVLGCYALLTGNLLRVVGPSHSESSSPSRMGSLFWYCLALKIKLSQSFRVLVSSDVTSQKTLISMFIIYPSCCGSDTFLFMFKITLAYKILRWEKENRSMDNLFKTPSDYAQNVYTLVSN